MTKQLPQYQTRPIRFVEIHDIMGWKIKIYSISIYQEFISETNLLDVKGQLPEWLKNAETCAYDKHHHATLIIHEWSGGCYGIINWWVDANMLQNFVYLRKHQETEFQLFSHHGICTCVWEMAVWWHERNAWVKHVLQKHEAPHFEAYLKDQLNTDI
ncbi:MAG: hypothetical protein EAZ57_08925 [Cytophagales bacterium]|nr:MAG: hypothetical protein EAZ67_09735 [Cytophagales bacterium]TAF60022.1 MAG: hypothetical protein EAZ57_08925 [Cytophagales bacterium]